MPHHQPALDAVAEEHGQVAGHGAKLRRRVLFPFGRREVRHHREQAVGDGVQIRQQVGVHGATVLADHLAEGILFFGGHFYFNRYHLREADPIGV